MLISERDELIGNISDDSKSVNGCRLRLNFKAMSLEELREEAAYWSARQQEAFEEHCRMEAEEDAYELQEERAAAAMPNTYDEIQDRLEGF